MTTTKKGPLSYLVKREGGVDKFVGLEKEASYLTDSMIGTCDCIGFSHKSYCKHLTFLALLDEFDVDELIFFGEKIGDCKPKKLTQIESLAGELQSILQPHFQYDDLTIKNYIQNPADPAVYNCIEFEGKRSPNTMVVGYVRGVMFIVRPGDE